MIVPALGQIRPSAPWTRAQAPGGTLNLLEADHGDRIARRRGLDGYKPQQDPRRRRGDVVPAGGGGWAALRQSREHGGLPEGRGPA